MKLSDVKKILKDNYKQSSLNVIPIRFIRERFEIPMSITDDQILGIAKSLYFEEFGRKRDMGESYK